MKRLLYLAARIFGDVNAVKKGRAGRRLGRRIVGRGTRKMGGNFLNKIRADQNEI